MTIKLKNVTKKINDVIILKDINLDLCPGHIYGFTGRNGSGKTMLFNIICGFVSSTEGEVIVNDINITKTKTIPQNMRALIEHSKFIPSLSGFKNLKLLASINNKITDSEILSTLGKVNLVTEKDKLVSKYSLGMKQKLGLAQVLMEDPEILILDEPFNALDEESVQKVKIILKEEKKKGKIILIATHIKEDIISLCDEVFVLNDGKIEKNTMKK